MRIFRVVIAIAIDYGNMSEITTLSDIIGQCAIGCVNRLFTPLSQWIESARYRAQFVCEEHYAMFRGPPVSQKPRRKLIRKL